MKIVVLDGYALNPGDLSWDGFKSISDVTIYDRTPLEKRYERVKDADIIITNRTLIDAELINKLTKAKYIGVLATGYNLVDLEAAKQKGIVVTNVPAYSTASVVQLVFAHILELCNYVALHDTAVRDGEWATCPDFSFWKKSLIELDGKTMGIIGYGNLGSKVAHIAEAFGMKVLVYSRTKKETSDSIEWVSLDELIVKSDIVTITCPLTESTRGMINKDFLAKMKNSALLINASRGPIIIEEDLKEALNNDVILGAAVDVLTVEPPVNGSPLLEAKNCIITPHIGWATRDARSRLMETAVENLKAFLNDNPINVVNK